MLEDSVSPKKYEGGRADPILQGRGRQALTPHSVAGVEYLERSCNQSKAVRRPHTPPRPQALRRRSSWWEGHERKKARVLLSVSPL